MYQQFRIKDFRDGMDWTVGAINGLPTDVRWNVETEVFEKLVSQKINGNPCKMLDYGCGIGRMSKALLDANPNLEIVGVDQSPEMLLHAQTYISNPRFRPMPDDEFLQMSFTEFQFDFGICVYCLQHVAAFDLDVIIKKLAESTPELLLINSQVRMAVPNFSNDGINVLDKVLKYYPETEYAIPAAMLLNNRVLRKMFLEGDWRHDAFWLKRRGQAC